MSDQLPGAGPRMTAGLQSPSRLGADFGAADPVGVHAIGDVSASATLSRSAALRANFVAWIRSPTTVAGLAALAGDLALVLTNAASWRIELPLALGSLVAMILPDNTQAAPLAARTLRDVLAAVASRDPAAIAVAVADATALLDQIEGKSV